MKKTVHPELYKAREIFLSRLPSQNQMRAVQALGALAHLETRSNPLRGCIAVNYDLRDHTLRELENLLAAGGCHLDNSLLNKIRRALIYHCETCQLENLLAPNRNDHLRRIYLNSSHIT